MFWLPHFSCYKWFHCCCADDCRNTYNGVVHYVVDYEKVLPLYIKFKFAKFFEFYSPFWHHPVWNNYKHKHSIQLNTREVWSELGLGWHWNKDEICEWNIKRLKFCQSPKNNLNCSRNQKEQQSTNNEWT